MSVISPAPPRSRLRPQDRIRTRYGKHGVFLGEPFPGRAQIVLDGRSQHEMCLAQELTPIGTTEPVSYAIADQLSHLLASPPKPIWTQFTKLQWVQIVDDALLLARLNTQIADAAPAFVAKRVIGYDVETPRATWERLDEDEHERFRAAWREIASTI